MKNIIILLNITLLSLVGYGQESTGIDVTDLIFHSKSEISKILGTPDSTYITKKRIGVYHYDNLTLFYNKEDICIAVAFSHGLEKLSDCIKINNKVYKKTGNLEWIDYQYKLDIEIIINEEKSYFTEVTMPLEQ